MMDSKGRVWMTSKIRNEEPAWCQRGPSQQVRGVLPAAHQRPPGVVLRSRPRQFALIDTCYRARTTCSSTTTRTRRSTSTSCRPDLRLDQHAVYDETDDEQASQAGARRSSTPTATAGSRSRGTCRGDNAAGSDAATPRCGYNLYAVIPSPVDDSVWGASEEYPGYLVRLDRGNNPPETCMTEVYRVPEPGFDPRGIDIDSNGVVWTALAASSHLASFDRRKCRGLERRRERRRARTAQRAGRSTSRRARSFKGTTSRPTSTITTGWTSTTSPGFGANTPIATGSNSDSLLALEPETGKWTTLRVPYPLGFYSRGLDGRIDDPEPAGRGAASGPTTARTSSGTSKAARAPGQDREIPDPAGPARALRESASSSRAALARASGKSLASAQVV